MKKNIACVKKKREEFCWLKKKPYLCIAIRNKGCLLRIAEIKIGIWCNGNTTDSGPVFPGSSPGIPTRERDFVMKPLFLVFTG